jgi:hypothetical protein
MTVQLRYFPACPHWRDARATLERAFAAVGLPAEYDLVDVTAAATSASLHGWGSPTILIDGVDAGGGAAACVAASCRLYEGARGWPSETTLVAALRAHREARR